MSEPMRCGPPGFSANTTAWSRQPKNLRTLCWMSKRRCIKWPTR